MRMLTLATLVGVFILALAHGADAANYTSSGRGTGKWSDPNSWTPPGVPGIGDSVTINPTHIITVKGGRVVDKLDVLPGGQLIGDPDVDLTVTTTVTVHPGGLISGRSFQTTGKGGDVSITCGGALQNDGVIAGGAGNGASTQNRPNPAEGKTGHAGGEVKVSCGGGVTNGKTGVIIGGPGSAGGSLNGTPNGGDGGKVSVKGRTVLNDGAISGGAAGDGATTAPTGHGADGGRVSVKGKSTNNGTIKGGAGGKAPAGKKPGTGGRVRVRKQRSTGPISGGVGGDGRFADVYVMSADGLDIVGTNATVTGGDVYLQADDVALVLSGLADGAIKATEGRVILVCPGTLDVRGNVQSTTPKIVARTGVTVLATSIMETFRGQFFGMCSTAPAISARAEIFAEGAAKVGTTYGMVIYSPADANANYYCFCSASVQNGIDLDGLGTLQLDADTLFWVSALNVAPFTNFAGTFDAFGQGMPSVAVPALPQLVGLTLYFQAVALQGASLKNVTTLSPALITM